ncbi:MAG: DUF1573 domain-containing protein [Niabella sp.]
MKKIIIPIAIIITLLACNSTENNAPATPLTAEEKVSSLQDSANFTTAEWIDSTSKNVGKVKKGQVVEIPYTIKNTGDKPLIISEVRPGCGCTVAEKPEKPIMPGEEEKIVAKFDSQHQNAGAHMKNVVVKANTKPLTEYVLNFTVDVVE